MFAEISIDLASQAGALKSLVAIVLVGIATFYCYRWFRTNYTWPTANVDEEKPTYKRKDSSRSSDAPPPEGFAEHLAIIEETAPNAGPEVWWRYAKDELTEAEVAIAEAKLARHE
jgi:hypothetical protein